MKILYKTMGLGLLSACLCLFCAAPAAAKVCFVGEENCTGGGSFDEYKDPAEDGKVCTDEGYILKSACDADPSRHVTGYCPYNSEYVMCCGNEYVYDSCVYPHVTVDKCGSKFKCQCDPEKYPYTEEACHTQFKFSNPGGTACTQIDAGTSSTIKTLYYSACLCERGLYPYSKDDCQTTANADVNGDPCQDSMGNQYWDSCKCNNPPYKWESVDCEFGGKGKACVQGGVYFFKECCSCAAFPAEGERGGKPNDTHATKWTTCDCPRKGRFRITQCEAGWQPNKDGSACERISCENAVKLFFSKETNKKTYASYGVFTGSKLVHYKALTEAEKAKLPEAQQTYAVGEEIEANSASTGVLAKNVSTSSKYCSTSSKYVDGKYVTVGGLEIGCTKAASIYSGAYFGTLSSSPDHKMLQESCGAYEPEKTVVPVISFSGSSFPNTNSRTSTICLYGAELKFSGTTNVNRSMYLYNTNLSGSGAVFNKYVYLYGYNDKPNGEKVTFKMTSSTFKNKLTSSNYNFDMGSLYLEVPTSYENRQIASFTLREGQEFRGSSLYIYPTSDTYKYVDNSFPGATNWGTYVNFYGPYTASAANVYTSVYVGYYGSKRARGMSVKLSGNLNWNMYEGSSKKYIGLTPASKITSTDYGSGNYARLVFGSNVYKSQCSMKGDVDYVVNRHKFLSCACKRWDNDADYYVSCKVNVNGNSTDGMYYSKTKVSDRKAGDCGRRGTNINPDCSISYDCGDRNPFSLLTCS
ncbi:MAG: hypothetical protein V8R89_06860 [Alphaproteobacteria bacterium]